MLQQILKHEITKIAALFIVWRLALLFVGFLALTLLPKIQAGQLVLEEINFWQSWSNWDGGHFIGIADNGYKFIQQYAFFPLLPATIWFFKHIFLNNSQIAALFVTNFLGLAAIIFLYKLARLDFDKNFSLKVVISLLFFPTAFFLGAVYSESAFLAASLASFYYLRKKRFLLSGILASFASLTKPYGILIIFPLVIEYFSQKKPKIKLGRQLFFFSLPIIVFCLYLVYLKNVAGDPLIFISVQKAWMRTAANPITIFWNYYLSFFKAPVNLFFGVRLTEFASGLLVLLTIIFGWKFLRPSYLVYVILLFLVFTSTGNLLSFARFVLILWPVFFVLASWSENFLFDFFYKVVSLSLLGIFTGLFLAGFFIS